MPKRKEVSFDPASFPQLHAARASQVDRHKSPLAALMEAAPFTEPEATTNELLPLREAIADAIESVLTERQRFVFHAVFIERLPLREIGRVLGLSKTQVARVRDKATRRLARALKDHPLVRPHLTDGV